MWGLIRLLAVIGALAGASVTAFAFQPGWLASAAMFLGLLLLGAMTLLERREHGTWPDWKLWQKAMPWWVRAATSVIILGCFLLSLYANFSSDRGKIVTLDGRYYEVRGQERTEVTREQYDRELFRADRFTGAIAVAVNIYVLGLAAVRRRKGSAA